MCPTCFFFACVCFRETVSTSVYGHLYLHADARQEVVKDAGDLASAVAAVPKSKQIRWDPAKKRYELAKARIVGNGWTLDVFNIPTADIRVLGIQA